MGEKELDKIYKYLKRSLFNGYQLDRPQASNKRFYVIKDSRAIIEFFLVNNMLYYETDRFIGSLIIAIKDIDYALGKCSETFCDNNFSLILKCNLI